MISIRIAVRAPNNYMAIKLIEQKQQKNGLQERKI